MAFLIFSIIFSFFNTYVFSSEDGERSAVDKPIISKIPDEIWIKVMSLNNPRVREWRVCNHFCRIFDKFVLSDHNKHIFSPSNQESLSYFLKESTIKSPNAPLISLSIYMAVDDLSFLGSLNDLKRLELCSEIKISPSILIKISQLQRLIMGGKNFNDSSEGNQAIGQLTQLQSLSLINNGLGHKGSHSSLISLTALTYLNVKDNQLDDDALNTFSTLTNLKVLNISENNKLTNVEKLSGLTKLGTLDLRGTEVQESSLEGIKAALVNMKYFM